MLQSIDITFRVNVSNTGNHTGEDFVQEMDYEFKSLTTGVDVIEAEMIDFEIIE